MSCLAQVGWSSVAWVKSVFQLQSLMSWPSRLGREKDAHLDKPNNCALVTVHLDGLRGTSGSCSGLSINLSEIHYFQTLVLAPL